MTAAPGHVGFGDDDEAAWSGPSAATLRAVRIAEKCFEIARSSPHRGEREAAASRGVAIAKKAGLRLELFDVPGRDEYHLKNALRDIDETLRRWAGALGANEQDTVYGAKRRAFDAATDAAAERDRANGRRSAAPLDRETIRRADLCDRWPSTGAALNALRARGVRVHPAEGSAADLDQAEQPRWYAPSRGLETFDEWRLRELADEVCA